MNNLAKNAKDAELLVMDENTLSEIIVDCCFKLHKKLGPGLFESVYEKILYYKLQKADLKCERQAPIPVIYDNKKFGIGFRIDLLVNEKVVIELKSVEKIQSIHKKQLLTY